MPLIETPKEALIGTAALGVAFATGVIIGKNLKLSTSEKTFEKENVAERRYAMKHSLREHPVLEKLRKHTIKDPRILETVSCDEAQLLTILAKLIRAKTVLTAGDTVTYLTLSMALSLPSDGRVICCYETAEEAEIGQPFWNEAGMEYKIELRVKATLLTLDELIDSGEGCTYDLVFINVNDQENPNDCFEKSLRLARRGGIIVLDGVLCQGRVLNAKAYDLLAQNLHHLNEKLLRDVRINIIILPMGDGVTVAVKL
ncbi:catechol O-methyltransferase domain-containing protein 1 [Ambystoma mexicanum]|uniref:catechol O-methyltransferase domain-containing protein 1 n=1 Tax=Ambystoma mexicanum TaxID=8296 RepID=UPI0037E71AE8